MNELVKSGAAREGEGKGEEGGTAIEMLFIFTGSRFGATSGGKRGEERMEKAVQTRGRCFLARRGS